ncbi:MAG TPA: hydroxymethylbilane synthase [Solirubrobacteraceae bacterium]
MRLGTRGSALALAQARLAAAAIGEDCEIVVVQTRGDRDRAAVDKSKWVAELERALLEDEIDVAVHSAKDVPAALADGTVLAGCLPREDARDVLVGAPLTAAARIGTASLRRTAQLRATRPDVEIVAVRGNVDTRLGKLATGEIDALVLAAAGLHRLGRDEAATPLDTVPAAGQGIVVLQAREGATLVRDDDAWQRLLAERACVAALGADCHSAVGAHAVRADGGLTLRAWAGAVDGSAWVADELRGEDPETLGREVAARMLAAGAAELLA